MGENMDKPPPTCLEFPFCLTTEAVRFGLDDVALVETSDSL